MKPKVKKILPFFRSLTPKMRVMVYLLGSGELSFDGVRKLKVWEFCDLTLVSNIPSTLELDDICSELKKQPPDNAVFSRDSGRTYSVTDVINVLKRAHKIAGMEYNGLDEFVDYVTS